MKSRSYMGWLMGLEPNREGRLGECRGLQVLDFIGIYIFSSPVIPRIPPRIPPQSSPVFYKSWAAVRRQEKKLNRIEKKCAASSCTC